MYMYHTLTHQSCTQCIKHVRYISLNQGNCILHATLDVPIYSPINSPTAYYSFCPSIQRCRRCMHLDLTFVLWMAFPSKISNMSLMAGTNVMLDELWAWWTEPIAPIYSNTHTPGMMSPLVGFKYVGCI